jgi:hypothetical protein
MVVSHFPIDKWQHLKAGDNENEETFFHALFCGCEVTEFTQNAL